ncbi:MAG: hypothetical protein KatS3mg097_093 [Candidatus Parcubacteria bacterium]|nr:MAG: hypothetical protein KatS3mg097_093 [Candidatus Parcubacteria bacterium]
MNRFTVKIFKIDGVAIEREVESLSCQTKSGEITILANHHPLVTILLKGYLKIKVQNNEERIYINNDCILEFANNEAKILEFF